MLKKAGIVVAAATAGLLAVSPLAFATDGGNNNSENHTQGGGLVSVVNVQDVTAQVPIQACNNNVNVIGVSDIVLGLLGSASSSDSCDQDNSAVDGPTQK